MGRGTGKGNTRSVHVAQLDSEDEADHFGHGDGGGDEDDSACIVSEEVGQELHTAFWAQQSARPRYKEAMKGRGFLTP